MPKAQTTEEYFSAVGWTLPPSPLSVSIGKAAQRYSILRRYVFLWGYRLRRYSPLENIVLETIVLETIVTEAEPGVPLPLVEVGVLRFDKVYAKV